MQDGNPLIILYRGSCVPASRHMCSRSLTPEALSHLSFTNNFSQAFPVEAHRSPRYRTFLESHIHQNKDHGQQHHARCQGHGLVPPYTSIIAVIARGITKALIVRSRSLDDYFIVLSLVSFICDLYCKCNMILQLMCSTNSAPQH